ISYPDVPAAEEHSAQYLPHHCDLKPFAGALARGEVSRLFLGGFAQRMENFLPLDFYRRVFQAVPQGAEVFGPDILLCSIRGGDILDGHHRDYVLIPPEFYLELVEQTGLAPVFMGQLGENTYCTRLRRLFPDARFVESRGPMIDFATIRQATNIVTSISTFSWLAAWLSHAQKIYMPLSGLFHPMQSREVDLVPRDDPRFVLYLFPINFSTPVHRFEACLNPLIGLWRRITPAMLTALQEDRPRFKPSREDCFAAFDEQYYCATHADVREAVDRGGFASGRDHYFHNGFQEGRPAFHFDERWYSAAYPMAAFEVGQGDFENLAQHYIAIGRARGYRPYPEQPLDDAGPAPAAPGYRSGS
ncbi:MAG: hypothetical protein JO264_02175, partial [Acidisphaera sp.]|nr:hypothetical protein [Acidisphaera sp.]